MEPSAATSYVVLEMLIGPSVLTVRPYEAVKSSWTLTFAPSDSLSSPLILTEVGPVFPPAMMRTSSPASLTDAAPSSGLSLDGGVVVTIWPLICAYHV